MKAKITIAFLYFFVLILSNLSGLELVKEVTLEKRDNINYQKLTKNFNNGNKIAAQYDYESGNVYVFLPTFSNLSANKTSNLMKLNNEIKKKYELLIFSKTGKYIRTIGHHGSHAKNGFLYLSDIKIVNNEIQLIADKLISFNKNNFKFKYYIDPSYPDDSDIKSPINLAMPSKCLGEQPYQFDITHSNSAFVAKLKDDFQYPNVKTIYNIKNFLSVRKYKNLIFGNYPKYQKILQKDSPQISSYVGIIWTNTVYVSTKFALMKDDSYLAINGFGTELFAYNKFDILQDSIYFKKISNMRKTEISNFTTQKKYNKNIKHFSHLDNFFYDNKKNRAFLYFSASKIMLEKYNSYRLLFIYSLKNRKALSDITPIDFYPVTYDEKNDLLVVLKVVNNQIKFQFYRI